MRLTQIDETNRHDHTRLTDADVCYFMYEYTSGRGFDFSRTNNLISNLKKKPSQRHKAGYHYKQRAILRCATELRDGLNPDWLSHATLVPIPCSKAEEHADYDDRVERICRSMGNHIDVRNLVVQTESTIASHEACEGERLTVDQLLEIYEIDEELTNPPPTAIGIVDDVLTVGRHYRAMYTKLHARFPNIPIIGLFVARRVFPDAADDFDNLDDL